MTVLCQVCQASTDANLCGRHTRILERALGDLPALLRELDVTISRQDRGTGAALYAMKRSRLQVPVVHYEEGDTTLPSTPWPLSWDAADLRWAVESTVQTWARHVLEARGIDPAGPLGVRPQTLLLTSIDSIRLDEAAAAMFDELTACKAQLEAAIDRQDPDVFAGRCDALDVRIDLSEDGGLQPRVSTCGADLYGRDGDDTVRCQVCGMTYDLADRKAAMADEVDDQWSRPQMIADALTTLDEPVNASTLRTWIERDAKLTVRLAGRAAPYPLVLQVGVDDDGKPLFRVGDVRARIAWAREQTRPQRSA